MPEEPKKKRAKYQILEDIEKPKIDNTYSVGRNNVPMSIINQAQANGTNAYRVENGLPTIDLPLVEVNGSINMTKYGMLRNNPKFKKVMEIERKEGVDAARRWLYSTQLSDLSDKMGNTFSEALITGGTWDIPIGKAYKEFKAWQHADDIISLSEHPTLIQEARMRTPEMKEKFINQLPTINENKSFSFAKEQFMGKNNSSYEELLDEVYSSTNLHTRRNNSALGFSNSIGDPGSVQRNMRSQDIFGLFGKRASNMDKAMIEAHEKTHGMVDNFSEEMMKDLKNSTTKKNLPGYKTHFNEEVIARMSMMKNALGMSGNEEFTKTQMDYLRKNYKNLPVSFDYKRMFDIVPKNSSQEKQFIKNMNKYAFGTAGTLGILQDNSKSDDMKKNNGGIVKFDDGGIIGNPGDPVTPKKKLTSSEIKKKYNNPYVTGGREQWGEYLESKKLPFSHTPVKKAIYNAAKSSGLDPALLYSSAMEEGLREGIDNPDVVSEAYLEAIGDGKVKKAKGQFDPNVYPIDGFRTYGLDTFGDQYNTLKKKGYLPDGFEQQFTPYKAENELKQQVTSAAFKSEDAALQAKAAMLRSTRDNLENYTKKNKVTLSDKQRDFFNLVGYNAGEGNMQKMIKSYQEKGYLKDDKFLTDTNFKPASFAQPYTYAQRRLVNDQILKDEGYFEDYTPPNQAPINPAQTGTMPDGGVMKGNQQQRYAALVAQYGKSGADRIINEQQVQNLANNQNPGFYNGPKVNNSYEPTQAVKNTKASLAALSLGTGAGSNPLSYLANVAGAVYDVGTGSRYIADGQYEKGLEDYTQAAIGLIPGLGSTGAKGNQFVTTGQRLFNTAIGTAAKSSDVKTMSESFKLGGTVKKRKNVIQPYAEIANFANNGIQLPFQKNAISTPENPILYDPLQAAIDELRGQFSQPQSVINDATLNGNQSLQNQYQDNNGSGDEQNFQPSSEQVDPTEESPSIGLKIAQGVMGAIPTINTGMGIQATAAIMNFATQGKDQTEEYARRVRRYNQQDMYNPYAYGTGSQALMNDGGSVKGISDNQFGSGIIQFNGPSHEDGGIPITYEGQFVEVEGGETAFINPQGDMNVFGNMYVPGTNKKFKTVSKNLAKEENNTQKTLDKAVDLVNTNEPTSKYARYDFNAGAVMMDGNTGKLQELDQIKTELANMQNIMLSMGHDEKSSEKGKLKYGGVVKAEGGLEIFGPGRGKRTTNKRKISEEIIPVELMKGPGRQIDVNVTPPERRLATIEDMEEVPYIEPSNPTTPVPPVSTPTQGRRKGFNIPNILPEIFTLATERPEFVPGQTYEPNLYNPYQVTFQDKLNENNASFRASQIAVGNNPAALAQLNAQKYQADSQVLGEEFRTNQAIQNQTTNQNVGLLNDAKIRNIGLADQQMVRQSQARSNTRENQRNALNSISSKFSQQALEEKTLAVYENMFPHFTYDNSGKLQFQDVKRPVFMNMQAGTSSSDFQRSRVQYDKNGKVEKTIINTPSNVDKSKMILQKEKYEQQRLGLFKKLFK